MSSTLSRGPLVTLAAVALVGAGLFVADALTDPARARVETPVAAAATTPATPATSATPTATTGTTAAASATPTATTVVPTTAAAAAAAYPTEAIYVGRDAARRTSVAIAVRDGNAAAYVCDGKSVESWLTGTATGTTATLTAGKDRLVAELVSGKLHVTGTVHGRAVDITAALASAPAGLYRLSSAKGTTIGWIVQPDGSYVGLETDPAGTRPAPPYQPGAPVTVDGQPAYPKVVSGDDRF